MGAVIIPQNLPVGYRFHPTDEEFVDHYLTNQVLGYVDHPCIIPEVDICQWDPWVLPRKFHEKSIIHWDDKVREWWFFSLQTTQQVKRSTPSGFWKKTGADRDVKARDAIIGTKKTLVFHTGRGSKGVKTNWVIHEYHLLTKDLNRNYVLCRLKHKRDEKADNSTMELEHEAIDLVDLDSVLDQPDHEDKFSEDMIQAQMKSLMEASFLPEDLVQVASRNPLQLFQPVQPPQINCMAPNRLQFMNTESPSFMDFSLDSDLTDESIQMESLFGTSEEDEDGGDLFNILQEQTWYGESSNSHNEQPVVKENRRAQTTDSVHGFVPFKEKKGMVENKFNGPPVTSEKPMPRPVPMARHRSMAPPIRPASVKCYGKDEEPRFGKVKQETAAINIKPESISLDETAARAKVLEYKECGSAGNSTKKTDSNEIEHGREKSNSVTASTGTTSESTESSTNSPLHNLVNVIVGIFLLLAITCQVLNF